MSRSERTRVGQTLDAIRDALETYVDDAMTMSLGPDWNDVVAEDDARRRPSGKKLPASKSDLAVILKVLIHRRIEPWSNPATHPRVRAFSSELLTLRNLYAHGDQCVGEHPRLIDTGGRLLRLLGLPVPAALEPPTVDSTSAATTAEAIELAKRLPNVVGRPDVEFDVLGVDGEQLAAILDRARSIAASVAQVVNDGLRSLDPHNPDVEPFFGRLGGLLTTAGEEVIGLLEETSQLAEEKKSPPPEWGLVVHGVRCELLSSTLGQATQAYLADLELQVAKQFGVELDRIRQWADAGQPENQMPLGAEDPAMKALQDRLDQARSMVEFGDGETARWQNLIQLASQFDDAHHLANVMIARASVALAQSHRDSGNWSGEALPYVRDAITRLRFMAGMEPGSIFESALVRALRFEGEIYTELGRNDDAIEAFARAREIVDRYPAADAAIER